MPELTNLFFVYFTYATVHDAVDTFLLARLWALADDVPYQANKGALAPFTYELRTTIFKR